MAEIVVSAALVLVEDVISFVRREVKLEKKVLDDVRHVGSMLRNIKSYMKDMDGREEIGEATKSLISDFRELAYDMEDVLLEFKYHKSETYYRNRLSKAGHKLSDILTLKSGRELHEISSSIKDIKRKMENLTESVQINPHEEGSSHYSRMEEADDKIHQIPKEDEMVGYLEEKRRLRHLVEENSGCMMKIWVVGSGGTGKTFLVKTVYESNKVLAYRTYEYRAWIHVSQAFKIAEVLRSMLKQFRGGRDSVSLSSSGEELKDELRNFLEGKSYVVVLDDIWRKDDFRNIMTALPDSCRRRRIIVTTRNQDVVTSCRELSDNHIELKGLPSPQDWELFCKKAFPGSQCPPELKDWSEKILKKCEGMPLAIAAVGSLLEKKEKNPSEWKTLHDSLGAEIGSDSSLKIISRILWPSYKDLSKYLRSCFLYFSIFPEDYSIPRGRLIRSWIAEGFIENKSGKTPEKVAEDYLNELIGRNLVSASAWDFDGRVSSCRVLNIVREFIMLISKEENFVTSLSEPGTSSDQKIRRLSINNSEIDLSHLIKGESSVRTLFVFERGDLISSKRGKLIGRSRYLRVLDLQGSSNVPEEIFEELTLLKCLSLRETNIQKIPKYIRNLAFLETLDLRQTYVTELPLEVLGLKLLRHLLVYRYNVRPHVTFDSVQGVEVPQGIGDLSSLQKLSCVKASSRSGVIKELKKLSQLRKLGLKDLKRKDGKALCEAIGKMEHLLTLDVCSAGEEEYIDLHNLVIHPHCVLQRLYLKGRLQELPGWISSLSSLVRIGLKWSRLRHSPLEALQALPNLLELHMVDCYMGELLEFKAETFRKLKILHLEQFEHLNMVVMEKNSMPELAKLTLCKCEQLKMLPLGMNHLSQLKQLLLYDVSCDLISSIADRDSEGRLAISHVPDIRSFTLDSNQSWSSKNVSRHDTF